MMTRMLLAAVLALGMTAQAGAGWRCGRSYQTIYSLNGWNSGCYNCHPKKQQQFSWKQAIIKLEETKQDYQAFNEALSKVAGAPQGYAAYGAAGYAGPYGSNTYSELTQQYGNLGATQYGVQAYSNDPLVDLNAVIQGQRMLSQQLAVGASSSAQDTSDIANQAYALENDRQIKIAQLATIASVGTAPVPQPTSTVFRQQQIVGPAQAEVTTHQEVTATNTGTNPEFIKLVNARCTACHTGQGNGVAKLDLGKEVSQNQLVIMAEAVDEGKMPLKPDGTAEKLSLAERALFINAAYPHK